MKRRSTTATRTYGKLTWLKCDRCHQSLQRFSLKGAWNAQPGTLHFNCPHCQQLYVEHRWIDYVHLIAFVIFILTLILALPLVSPDWSEQKMDELGVLYLLLFFSLIAYLRGITRPLVSLRMKFDLDNNKPN